MSLLKSFKTTKGKTYKVNLSKFSKQTDKCSSLHKKVREILKRTIPLTYWCEEFLVKDETILEFDFYIHSHKLAIEVQGQQHYNYNPFFHKSKQDFINQQKRDKLKEKWCEINGVELLSLKYNEQELWEETIGNSTRIFSWTQREDTKS